MPAYIVTIEEDTLQGYLLNQMDKEIGFEVIFKKDSLASESRTYTINELLGFAFDNGRTFNRMSTEKKYEDTLFVFAKNVLRGKIDMWVWRHKKEEPDIFLINNRKDKYIHLTEPKKVMVEIDNKRYLKKDIMYMGLLNYVKNDSLILKPKKKVINYSEKRIKEHILEYNEDFEEEYPIQAYSMIPDYTYDFLVGVPFNVPMNGIYFRAAAYRSKYYREESITRSNIMGVTYRGWHNPEIDKTEGRFREGLMNYRRQTVSIIPWGIKFEGKEENLRLYAHLGIGFAMVLTNSYKYEFYEKVDEITNLRTHPTLNLGLGAKLKLGSGYLLAELSPSGNGHFINLGYSF